MADSRINLLSSASSTASDDFFVVDGTTNGTRKLNAFSPTIGGNLAVTGTLTVNSSSPSVFAGQVRSNLSNASLGDPQIFVRNPAASLTNGAVSQAAFFGQPGYTTFVGTTGDGTTASYQGGVLGSAIRFSEGYVITDAANGLLLHGINGSIRLATGNPGSVKATFDSAGTLYLTATTASTTTTSGALVVSGGVGVAGAIFAGGNIQCNAVYASNNTTLYLRPQGATVSSGEAQLTTTGNLTLAGTLTVNGGTASVASANGTTSSMVRSTVGGTATTGNGIFSSYLSSLIEWQFGGVSSDSSFRISSNGLGTADQFKITSSGNVSIPSTAISSTTSSGALVIGNGTSGGLGVGGAINAGSYLRSINSAAANDTEFTALRADVGADGTLGAATVAIGSLPSATGTSRYGFITCSDNVDWRKLYIGGRPGLAVSGGQVLIPCTTASTSTSSGALVVSGGVGIGGSLNAGANNAANSITGGDSGSGTYILQLKDGGGNLKVNFKGNGDVNLQSSTASTSTSSGALVVSGGVGVGGAIFAGQSVSVVQSLADNNGFRIINTNTAGLPGLYIEGDGGEYALIRRQNSTAGSPRRLEYIATGSGANHYFNTNTIIAGTITTNAPSGGTAAAWKLGTVATVSPTSPNRTIEVDIGGTIYYIHAKTTNN